MTIVIGARNDHMYVRGKSLPNAFERQTSKNDKQAQHEAGIGLDRCEASRCRSAGKRDAKEGRGKSRAYGKEGRAETRKRSTLVQRTLGGAQEAPALVRESGRLRAIWA